MPPRVERWLNVFIFNDSYMKLICPTQSR